MIVAHHITILIAEDDPSINDLLSELLTEEGYHIVTSFDGQAAYQIAARLKPDLVLTDMRMETPDAGLELLRRLRADANTATIKVLICSADSDQLSSHRTNVLALGAEMFPKPFRIERLLATIKQLLVEHNEE